MMLQPLTRGLVVLAAATGAWLAGGGRAEAQLGSLISPGKLARAHASLEGLANCQKCHEQGRKVTATKCLTCHEPVARRVAAGRGVHKDVKNECVSCHVEHAGLDGELRPFDTQRFDHARVAGYALDGLHAKVAADCKACHKSRSYLSASTSCATCHTDVHKGSLGKDCAACHTTRVAFDEPSGRFDHSKAAFPLTGAHKTVACADCHANKVFKGLKFASCTDCHQQPHRQNLGPSCNSCHSTETWRTRKIDHGRTTFPLTGRHVDVACATCHTQPPMKARLRAETCGTCHVDVHLGAFKQDCQACHSEDGFGNAPFDHSGTPFPLTGSHAPLKCVACHTTASAVQPAAPPGSRPVAGRSAVVSLTSLDFRGLKSACVSCHRDVHDGTLGETCETCHSAQSFAVSNYVHKSRQDFFGGKHAAVTCDKCHLSRPRPIGPVSQPVHVIFNDATTTCASCHADVHLGQVGTACESCHAISGSKFAVVGFSHDRTAYKLTGQHQTVACERCHKRETAVFPAKTGEAVRLTGLSVECRACHQDEHAGQIENPCETCHTTATFQVSKYLHQSTMLAAAGFFKGRHVAACQACHKRVTAQFPAGRATTVQYAVDTRCSSCHTDVHRGALGDRCIDCHRP